VNSARFDYILRQVLIVPVFAALVGAAAVYWEIHDANLTVAEIQVADHSINQTLLVERLVVDQETGLRGFQTTGDEQFLGPYNDAEKQMDAAFDALREGSDPDEAPIVDEIESIHSGWDQGFAVPLIATIRAGGKTNDVTLNLQGRVQIDAMRRKLAELTRADEQDRQAHIDHYGRQVKRLAAALIIFAVILGLVIGLYTRTLVHDLSEAFKRSSNILRLRADEAFRSEQRLRTTLASIGDGVVTCSLDGLVQTLNEAAVQLTGWTDEEARGAPLSRIFAIFDSRTHQPLEDPIARSKVANHAVKLGEHALLLRKDGSEIQVDDSLAPIRDEQGQIMGFVLVFRDVTLARKSQQALIANEKLAVAGRLAATIAHEIHNPLDSISNLLFLMDGQSTPEETAHFLALARQEIARVTQISRSMLSLYRESRAPIAIDIKDMLESILMLMERRFAILNVTIETTLPPDLIIHGFPGELRQVFTNLLTNAAEASESGSTVHLTAYPEQDHLSEDGLRHEDGACVTIADTGSGVQEDVLHKLFQPFFSTKGEQGTGLGLWVSRGIIVKHGGAIHLTSSAAPADHGTTVTVFLATNPVINAGGD
jgi:PAS domain S-box-containing protein